MNSKGVKLNIHARIDVLGVIDIVLQRLDATLKHPICFNCKCKLLKKSAICFGVQQPDVDAFS